MEPEQTKFSPEVAPIKIDRLAPLKQVTPLSKYLAMALFILLPFIGGWIGYQYAPEKVVEVVKHTSVIEDDALSDDIPYAADTDYKTPGYGIFVYIDPAKYKISQQYFVDKAQPNEFVPEDIYAHQARRLSEDVILLSFTSSGRHSPYATVLFDEKTNLIIRHVEYPWFSNDAWSSQSVQIFVKEGMQDEKPQIIARDYLSNEEEVLYEEIESDVQLSDICEVGCVGVLYVTSDAQVVFGRHKKSTGTTATQLIEIVTVSLPESFLSMQQIQYMGDVNEIR